MTYKDRSRPPPFFKHGGIAHRPRRLSAHSYQLGTIPIPHGSLPSNYTLFMGRMNSPVANLMYPQLAK